MGNKMVGEFARYIKKYCKERQKEKEPCSECEFWVGDSPFFKYCAFARGVEPKEWKIENEKYSG